MIELLVVLAIIALLAALLFPILAKSHEEARRTACASNIRQLWFAFQQYTQDNNETFPPVFSEKPMGWAGRIYPYVRSKPIYSCPNDLTASVVSGAQVAVPCSYALNADFLPEEVIGVSGGVVVRFPGFHSGLPVSALTAPANTIELCEVGNAPVVVDALDEGTANYTRSPLGDFSSPFANGLEGNSYFCGGGWLQNNNPELASKCASYVEGAHASSINGGDPRHTSGANYLAADGHVKYLLPTQISIGPNGTPGAPEFLPHGLMSTPQAASVTSMKLANGDPIAMTFSVR